MQKGNIKIGLDFLFLFCAKAVFIPRHNNHLVRVRIASWFGLKYLFWSLQSQLEMVLTPLAHLAALLNAISQHLPDRCDRGLISTHKHSVNECGMLDWLQM